MLASVDLFLGFCQCRISLFLVLAGSQEFELDEFCISMPARIGVHCVSAREEEGVVQLLNRAFNTLKDTKDTAAISLTEPARKQLDALQCSPRTHDRLSRELLELANGTNQASLMEVLSPALSVLDEQLRLKLVDQLLEVSTQARAM